MSDKPTKIPRVDYDEAEPLDCLRFNLDFVRARALADQLEANMKRMGIYQGKKWSYANMPGLPA